MHGLIGFQLTCKMLQQRPINFISSKMYNADDTTHTAGEHSDMGEDVEYTASACM